MENRKLIKLSLIILSTVFTASFWAVPKTHAYDFETHAFLTQEIVKLYDKTANLPENLSAYLVDGSRREDDSPRWLHHFYDPIYNRGYSSDPRTGALLNVGTSHESSKLWAQDPGKQNEPTYKVASLIASALDSIQQKKLNITTESDFTWNAALDYWAAGDKEKAMFALGHVLHLIEDASVPDHTRNNGHADGSPYEQWAAQFNMQHPDAAFATYMQNKQPIVFANLNDSFNSIANYSNKGFYSKDTIGIQSGYNLPEPNGLIVNSDACYAVNNVQNGDSYILYRRIGCNNFLTGTNFLMSLKDNSVSLDYWSRLGPQAVQHGSGVLALFFQQAQAHQVQNDQSWIEQIQQWLKNQTQSIQMLLGAAFHPEQDVTPYPTISQLPSPTPSVVTMQMPDSSMSPAPIPSEYATTLMPPDPTIIPTPAQSPAWPQFLNAQTPNTPTETPIPPQNAVPEQTPTQLPAPTLEPTPEITLSPTPEISSEPTPIATPEPSPTPELPSPIPTPLVQQSNNAFFSNVSWYFDQTVAQDQGGTFTIELDMQTLLPLNDFHALIAAWNTDLALTAGSKQEGGNSLVPLYSMAKQTGSIVNRNHPLYGPAETAWQWEGTYDAISEEFPQHLTIHPTNILISSDNWLETATSTGITRQEMETALGRNVGTNDFITVGYWPLYNNQTPELDNTHYFGSFLDSSSTTVIYPTPRSIPNIKDLRWGPSDRGQWTIEFMYSLPLAEVFDPWSTNGYELRFHLNSTANFLYGYDITLGQPGFLENGANDIVLTQYQTCDWNSSFSGKQGFRYPMNDTCSISGFNATAINPNQLAQTQSPEQRTWIVSLPIWNIPKDIASLSAADFLTTSLLVYDTGPNTGLHLRQIDSRQWHFSPIYTPLAVPQPSLEPTPDPSPSPSPDITPLSTPDITPSPDPTVSPEPV